MPTERAAPSEHKTAQRLSGWEKAACTTSAQAAYFLSGCLETCIPLHLDGWLIPHDINLRKSEPQLWRVLVCWCGRREGMSAPPYMFPLLGSSTTPRMLPVPDTVPPGQREPQERGKWLREHILLAWSQVVFLNCKAAQYRDKTVKQAQP